MTILHPLLRRDGDSMDAYHLFDAPTFHDECQRLSQINADLLDQMEALEAAHRRTLDKLTKNSMYSAVGVLEETMGRRPSVHMARERRRRSSIGGALTLLSCSIRVSPQPQAAMGCGKKSWRT